MKYYELIMATIAWGCHNEAIGWICLVLMVLPPIIKLGFQWSAQMQRENATYTGIIDDDGFYL